MKKIMKSILASLAVTFISLCMCFADGFIQEKQSVRAYVEETFEDYFDLDAGLKKKVPITLKVKSRIQISGTTDSKKNADYSLLRGEDIIFKSGFNPKAIAVDEEVPAGTYYFVIENKGWSEKRSGSFIVTITPLENEYIIIQ